MTIEAPGRDVIPIQMLRGIAATMVVFVHINNQLARLHYGTLDSRWLATGVDIFFVISGFIMWTSVERRGGMRAGAFLKNRIIRIVPLYWFITTAVLLVALIAPQVLKTTIVQPWHVLASYLFFPARHPVTGQFWPLVVPGWSLNFEMLFYAVFALALALARGKRILRFGVIVGVLAAIMLVASLTRERIDIMNFYANPMLFEFVTGIILGMICELGIVRRSALWLLVIIVGFMLLWAAVHFNGGFAVTLIAATMIVGGAVFLPPIRHNPVSSLGDASYSLYLSHAICLSAIGLAWGHLFPEAPWQLFVLSAVAIAFAIAFLLYRYFEVPVTAELKRRMSQNVRVRSVAAPSATEPLR